MTEKDSESTKRKEIVKIKPIERGLSGRICNKIGRALVRMFTRFEVRGLENLPASAPYIIAPNHETYIDGLFVSMRLPDDHFAKFTSLAAKELEESRGWFGKVIMRVGRGIPIDRKGSALQSLRISIHALEAGNILLIHPEGTRTPNGKIGKIHDGCAFIAQHTGCVVVPAFIDGGYEIFSRHMTWPKPFKSFGRRRRLIVTYGEPMDPADYEDTHAMTAAISAWLHGMDANKEVPREYTGVNLIQKEKQEARAARRRQQEAADEKLRTAEKTAETAREKNDASSSAPSASPGKDTASSGKS